MFKNRLIRFGSSWRVGIFLLISITCGITKQQGLQTQTISQQQKQLLLPTLPLAQQQQFQLQPPSRQRFSPVQLQPHQRRHSNAIMGEAGVTSSYMQQGTSLLSGGAYPNFENIPYDAPDDCNFLPAGRLDSLSIALTCNLRTINSEFDTTNFSVIPSENTVALHILCNDEIMAKSSLEPRSFEHLVRLQELSIQYCKIAKLNRHALEGLNQLRNLTIRTNNVVWPAVSFEIEPEAFFDVTNLERLDMSSNNIWSLPDGIFCSLSGLSVLNMSENRLEDINELGFRYRIKELKALTEFTVLYSTLASTSTAQGSPTVQCNVDLEIFDISHNHFVLLPDNSFGTLRRLRVLAVNNNEISMIADKALNGLRTLQIINLSSNKIIALPSDLFTEQTSSIQEIYLQNNSISVLSPKLFLNLDYLQILDLSHNQISSTWIDRLTFTGLIRLVSLNLSHNKLTKLESEIFMDLYTLQILNLRHNQLEDISADTFAPMNNLHTLLLSHNRLKYLDAYALNGLYVLSLLSLDNNDLTNVHPDALKNCSSLQDLNLNGNQLKTVPMALRNMRLLRTVDLGENMISVLEENSFKDLSNLYGLRLIGNFIENISMNAFKGLPNLQILNLARNRISIVEPGAFEITSSIQAIRLDGNDLAEISGVFSKMPTLLWLNISDNRLEHFDYAHMPSTLQWLDLHKNYVSDLANRFGFNAEVHLQTLDVSFNEIQRISPTSIPNSIELLFLNDNRISIVEADTFMHKNNLTRVDLYANQITTLDVKSLRILPVQEDKPLPEFYIGGNPYTCDCSIDWLQKINHIRSRQYPRIMDLETIYCKLLNNRERTYIPLAKAEAKHFLCPYQTHCFTVCHCCEFDACDCEMICPTNCTCFHDQTWSTNVVECSRSQYREIPRKVPMDTTELYIDGNDFVELAGHSFLGRKNLAVLFINNSNIYFIYNNTFAGLKRLLVLHLEDNRITKIQGNELKSLENLRELFLHNNRIAYIGNGSFQSLRKLEVLRLDGNRLLHFEVWQLTHNPYLVEISLADNPWSCECSFLAHFRVFLDQRSEKILDAPHVACVYNNATSVLHEKNGTKCTLREDLATYVNSSEIASLLPLLLVATCAFIGFFGLILGIFCYRQDLNMWAHSNCFSTCYGSSGFSTNLDKDCLNDAFFGYSIHDSHFVDQILAITLENDIGYRLCLHYRDVNVNAYVTDIIIEAVENSKLFVLVLSKNFLYNEWSHFEYKSALHEMVKRKKRIVFILYGDLPQRDIDMDMRHYLRTSTCIEWDDKKFWQKLRIALPPINQKRPTNCSTAPSSIIYGSTNDYQPASRRITEKNFSECNSYATISDCTRRYTPIVPSAMGPFKFNTLTELSMCKGHGQIGAMSIPGCAKRRHHHEYAVPNYLAEVNERLNGGEASVIGQKHEIDGPSISMPSNWNCINDTGVGDSDGKGQIKSAAYSRFTSNASKQCNCAYSNNLAGKGGARLCSCSENRTNASYIGDIVAGAGTSISTSSNSSISRTSKSENNGHAPNTANYESNISLNDDDDDEDTSHATNSNRLWA